MVKKLLRFEVKKGLKLCVFWTKWNLRAAINTVIKANQGRSLTASM